MIPLWCMTIDCNKTDNNNKELWTWAALRYYAVWKSYWQSMADAVLYIPDLFDRPPCKACHECESLTSIYESTHGKTHGYSTYKSGLHTPSLSHRSGSAIWCQWVLIMGTCHIHHLHDQFWQEDLSLDLRSGNLSLARFQNSACIYIYI